MPSPRGRGANHDSPPPAGEPLVPILKVEDGLGDPVALETWHEALSDALSSDIPHDLLGMWLYPAGGSVVLLGPAALAQDDLAVPLPAATLQPAQLSVVEELVRDAGYGSVACVPVRFGKRDVGLILVADLQPGRYGDTEIVLLRLVAQRLAPTLGRIARQWGTAGSAADQTARVAALLEAVTIANTQTATPQLYVAALSRALEPLLPHDHAELLVAHPAGQTYYRLGEHVGGALWADPSLELSRELLDVEGLFGGQDRLSIPDTYRDPRWPRGYFTAADQDGAEIRAVIGSRIPGPAALRAYLLMGNVGPELYSDDDVQLLGKVAGLIAAQVTLMAAGPPSRPAAAPELPAPARITLEAATLLATVTDIPEATRRVAELASRVLPFDTMRYAIRLSEGDRVVLVEPGETRPLPDLPLIPVAGTALADVLQGQRPDAFALVEGEARLVVPLRVAGRIHGALVFTAAPPAVLREVHTPIALQLADVVAPHLELLRRAALLPPPYLPGWKRAPRSS